MVALEWRALADSAWNTWLGWTSGTSQVAQWPRLCSQYRGDPGSIPGQGTSSHMEQLQTQSKQTNKYQKGNAACKGTDGHGALRRTRQLRGSDPRCAAGVRAQGNVRHSHQEKSYKNPDRGSSEMAMSAKTTHREKRSYRWLSHQVKWLRDNLVSLTWGIWTWHKRTYKTGTDSQT